MTVQLRVERIDGSLEPSIGIDDPVHAEWLQKADAVGSTFALDDGRRVTVIAHGRGEDGTLCDVLVGEVPQQRSYSASGHEAWVRDPHEMRMGSPQYGTLILDGEPLEIGSVDEASPVWSSDGGYLAVAVLEGWNRYPTTETVVLDADSRAVLARSSTVAGIVRPVRFVGRSVLYAQNRVDLDGPYPGTAFLRF
jgi:hypothetical protein